MPASDELFVPDGWRATTLGELGRYLNGRAFKTSEWSKHGRPIIRIQDLTGSNRNPNYFEGEVEDRYVVQPGDFLISWSATLGAYIWDGPVAVLNQHIFKVESNIHKRFHYHLVRGRIAELGRNAHGSGMVHVTKSTFDNTPVAVPADRDVQAAIAASLDFSDARMASTQQHLDAARQAIEQFSKAVLVAACTGRLTADWRAANPNATSVNQALTTLKNSNRIRRITREQPVELTVPELPESYVVASIGISSTLLEYGTSERLQSAPDQGIPVLRMGNIQDGKLDLRELKFRSLDKELEGLMLQDGDLLFNRTNSPELVGKSAVFHGTDPMSFASYLIRVRFDPEIALPDFVNYWINSAWGRLWARQVKTDGVSQSNINGSKLALMPVPLPPVQEQRVIVERASTMLKLADQLSARIGRATEKANITSRAVLIKAFRGEIAGKGSIDGA